jgi:hypothetical protein
MVVGACRAIANDAGALSADATDRTGARTGELRGD